MFSRYDVCWDICMDQWTDTPLAWLKRNFIIIHFFFTLWNPRNVTIPSLFAKPSLVYQSSYSIAVPSGITPIHNNDNIVTALSSCYAHSFLVPPASWGSQTWAAALHQNASEIPTLLMYENVIWSECWGSPLDSLNSRAPEGGNLKYWGPLKVTASIHTL